MPRGTIAPKAPLLGHRPSGIDAGVAREHRLRFDRDERAWHVTGIDPFDVVAAHSRTLRGHRDDPTQYPAEVANDWIAKRLSGTVICALSTVNPSLVGGRDSFMLHDAPALESVIDASREVRRRSLGAQIRALRTERKFSAVALARACEVSPSTISQVERGVISPSLEVLWAIARALDVAMGTFFQGEFDTTTAPIGRYATVVRANHRKRLGVTRSLTYELLSPDLRRQIEFVWIELGPGEEGPQQPFSHEGEEQMVVIEGDLWMWIGGEEYLLGPGDAITFDCAIPHRAANRTGRRTVAISAATPPSF